MLRAELAAAQVSDKHLRLKAIPAGYALRYERSTR